jgi:hypothetical protein
LDDVQDAATVEPLLDAEKFTRPELNEAVKVPEPCEVQPEQEIVKPLPPLPMITVKDALPVSPLWDAVIVETPVATPVANPELLMVAMFVEEELQFTEEVTSRLVLSPNAPIAMYCWVPLSSMLEVAGVTEIPTNVSGSGKNFPQAVVKSRGTARKRMEKKIRSGE